MGNAWSSLVWFVVIAALIPISLRLLRRTPMGGASSAGVMRSVAALSISTSQRIVTIEVGSGAERRWLVLGVTPTSITTLHTMAPQGEAADAGSPGAQSGAVPFVGPAFAQVLGRLRRDKKAGDAG